MKQLNKLIDTYQDYPKKGIEFKDVLGIIQEPKVFKELILKMSSSQIIKKAEAIISKNLFIAIDFKQETIKKYCNLFSAYFCRNKHLRRI